MLPGMVPWLPSLVAIPEYAFLFPTQILLHLNLALLFCPGYRLFIERGPMHSLSLVSHLLIHWEPVSALAGFIFWQQDIFCELLVILL